MKEIVDIAAGMKHSLALDSSGRLFAWGANNHGQLGQGENIFGNRQKFLPTQVPIPEQKKIVKIAAGDRFSMAVADDLTVYTFGSNFADETQWTPTLLDLSSAIPGFRITDVVDVAGGERHGCILVDVERTQSDAPDFQPARP